MTTRENRKSTARVSGEKNQHLARRASELAMNHGRPADAVTDADLIWAKRELKPMEISSPTKKSSRGF
jgi:hypothetical protein